MYRVWEDRVAARDADLDDSVATLQAEDCTIRAEILSINRGGALVNFEGLRGFLPGSHAPRGKIRRFLDIGDQARLVLDKIVDDEPVPGLTDDMVGTLIPLKFLEVDQVHFSLKHDSLVFGMRVVPLSSLCCGRGLWYMS